MGYDAGAWADFCAAVMGTSGALSGLLIVAVTINIERILAYPGLSARAAATLILFAAPLVLCALVLAPGQPRGALAAELLATGAVLGWALTAAHARAARAPDRRDRSRHLRTATTLLCAGGVLLAGATLAAGWGGGLYWLLPTVLGAFVLGLLATWVLLVEILR
ncbi:hypothetical protein EDD29_2381 [Actinocorallia herbida]|uniref:Modulator of FtsH protease n=1 Tax=Actinocorallia herbida TaxID=58109 RepID=A0A3N1CU67_9ACTN|nr:hypothetical protein [Actinocorallia herbida]ROO84852.1 hypothetical protein EDD29_2381 [Actinocorallia herbida]